MRVPMPTPIGDIGFGEFPYTRGVSGMFPPALADASVFGVQMPSTNERWNFLQVAR
jgi:hypothetical protein